MSPGLLAEQQRAKSEIEAALTVAAANPRDEKGALDRIMVSCQRPTLAATAQYAYSRGGTAISGPSIDLMEVVAQQWGNLEFGFRELARFPGSGRQVGESIVEAFSWDLQTNTRRRTQFTVPHAYKAKGALKKLTDPRDIYEWVANQAQRRVRTCLENIIPRDIVDTACEECSRTLVANVDLSPKSIGKLVTAFGTYGITKEHLEKRIQRRMEAITAAQVIHLRKIWAALRDGISEPGDWFDVQPPPSANPAKSATEAAKTAIRGAAGEGPPPPEQPPSTDPHQAAGDAAEREVAAGPNGAAPEPAPPAAETPAAGTDVDWKSYQANLDDTRGLRVVDNIAADIVKRIPQGDEKSMQRAIDMAEARKEAIRAKRGGKSNGGKETQAGMFGEASAHGSL